MRILEIVVITTMTGFVGAGLVWFGWGLLENVGMLLRAGRSERDSLEPDSDEPAE